MFIIESLPAERSYPPALASLKRAQFWTQPENSETKQRLSPDEKQWDSKVQDVADHIKTLLRTLHDAGGLEQAIRVTPLVDRPSPPLRTALLAQVRARCPPDLPNGYARQQYEMAKGVAETRKDFSLLLWRQPELDPAAVTNNDRVLLTTPETMAMGLESFKAEIVKRIEQANAPKRRELERDPDTGIHVFINAVEQDQGIAESVQKDFLRNGCKAFLPIYDGEPAQLRADLEDKINWCDALVLVYGEAHPRWISSQAMAYSKLKRTRTEQRGCFPICRAPPQPKPKHGVAMPELCEIDYTAGSPDDPIKQVVAELRA
jgi:hypothetical protein